MDDLDYLYVLKAVQEIPFGVGKSLLADFLRGSEATESVAKNNLNKLDNFAVLAYSKPELISMIESLIAQELLKYKKTGFGWKVLKITAKGKKEIKNPTVHKKVEHDSQITPKDRELFKMFGPVLEGLDDQQKKALISTANHILCIAGAGSGKTTVLTKRVEFLIDYRSVEPKDILAITFTRKARQEMMKRLPSLGVHIETFNSFCEKILRKHNKKIYGKKMKVITFDQKIKLIRQALSHLNLNMKRAIDIYFDSNKGKTDEELALMFTNDCFFVRDYLKAKKRPFNDFSQEMDDNQKKAKLVYDIICYINEFMEKHGLRDFTDQVVDTIEFFENNPEHIPQYKHILVDEYQDVNDRQVQLLDLLDPENLFVVGDPRQSIFGWRGSDISYINNFGKKHESEKIHLVNNYRSVEPIVNLINHSIRHMGLPDLRANRKGKKKIHLVSFSSEQSEYDFVAKKIRQSKIPRNQIFVLARTNRQLKELSRKFTNIKHVVRSDELRRTVFAQQDEVTLSTIHSIKGMEAELVFVVGCNSANFPCRATEHPVLEFVKVDEYDKEEEERRLFYVALSRARTRLYLSYSGKAPTYFINSSMLKYIDGLQTTLKNDY